MKTIINSWHNGITGVRLARQFATETRRLRDADADDAPVSPDVQRVMALAIKNLGYCRC